LIDAPLGLIGVGEENDYGHPAGSALTLLADSGTTVLRTDRDGSIAVWPGPHGIQVLTERGPPSAG
jgi:competence protein ComEC